MILKALLSMASISVRCEVGAPAQRGEQYSNQAANKGLVGCQKLRPANKRPCTTEEPSRQLVGGHLGNMVDPRKITVVGEAQKFE